MHLESQATVAGPLRRRTAGARALCAGLCLLAPAPALAAAGAGPAAEIELRKSFRAAPAPRAGASPRGVPAARAGTLPAPPPAALYARRSAGLARALGESIVASGTLHLPGVAGSGLTLDAARTPLLEFGTGRRVILDAGGVIPEATAAEITRRWPGYAVVRPPRGQGLRGLLDELLAASGYASVQRRPTLTFGREATVALRPDYVLLKRDDDLLSGETATLTVIDPGGEALPAELRELARQHRIRVAEVTADGAFLGEGPPPWRDPVGLITTVESRSAALVVGELVENLGLTPDRAALPPPGSATAALSAAVGALLARSGLPAIGPAVEFARAAPAGSRGRFTICVPGWLATRDNGRRLLVTGSTLPEPLRLFLVREGIDLFQYRLLAGR